MAAHAERRAPDYTTKSTMNSRIKLRSPSASFELVEVADTMTQVLTLSRGTQTTCTTTSKSLRMPPTAKSNSSSAGSNTLRLNRRNAVSAISRQTLTLDEFGAVEGIALTNVPQCIASDMYFSSTVNSTLSSIDPSRTV